MLRRFTWLFFSLLVFVCFDLQGQHGLSLVYAPSKVIKHRSTLLFDVPQRTHEFRLAYTFQTSGKRRWERYWRKPRIAINGLYVNFGDKEVLGEAFALIPEIHFVLKKWKDFRLNLQFGTGIAYLNKPYDAITNTENNAIGSFFNNISSLKFGLEYQWNERWATSLSAGLVHFSNGLSSSPNAGINIYGLSFSGIYKFGVEPKEDVDFELNYQEEETSFRKWVFDVQYHYGFTEHTVPGGPKYGVHALGVGAGYRYTEFLTAFIGGEYEFNEGTYTFFKRNFYTDEESLERARSTIIYVENELRYGRVFNRFRMGFYLPYPRNNGRTFYTKFISGIYLPEIGGLARPYIGAVLKTHKAVADYLGIQFGVSI